MAKGKFVQSLVKSAEEAGLLDMSEAARMARAQELGFDTDNVFYHGTDAEFSAFDPEYLGRNTMGNASDPAYGATSYAGFWHNSGEIKDAVNSPYSSYMENYIKMDSPLEFDSLDDLAEELRRVIPEDYDDTTEVEQAVRRWIDEKKSEGYDGVKIADEEFGGVSMAPFDASQIRSINAAFDPSKKDSPNLLASILPAAAGVGGTAAILGQSESAQAMPEPKGRFAKSLMDTYLKQQVAKPMTPDERLQYGQGFGYQGKIEPVQNEWAAKAAEYSEKYNKWRRDNVHPVVDMALPVGELPADVLRKMSYGDKVKYMDSVMAGLGML